MKLTAWGTRGSLSTCVKSLDDPEKLLGTQTSCYEILSSKNERIIFDAGSGIFDLGFHWNDDLTAHLFLTHFHYDHLVGLPFFQPFFQPGFILNAYHPSSDLCKNIENFYREPFSPLPFELVETRFKYTQLTGDFFSFNKDIKIEWRLNFHPGTSYSYKITEEKKSIILASDIELLEEDFHDTEKNRSFWGGADILIIDAQYEKEEVLSSKKGWGHSCKADCLKLAKEFGIKSMYFTHHDPSVSDEEQYERFELFLAENEKVLKDFEIKCSLLRMGDIIEC